MINQRKKYVFFIGGSYFNKYISNNSSWIYNLKELDYDIKNSPTAELDILVTDCQKFIRRCLEKIY